MSTSFKDLIEEVLSDMRGTVRNQEQSTHLTADVTNTATSWSVANATRLAPGRVECGDELVFIDSFDKSANTITIAPYGRAFDGSVAVAHTSGTQIVSNPRFPRMKVKNAINNTIRGLAGNLFAVDSTVLTVTPGVQEYELPFDALDVLSVNVEYSSNVWSESTYWRFNPQASTSDFPSGVSINLGEWGVGRVEVTYATDPLPLVNLTDDFAVVTGLPESCRDVISLGAEWRLLSTLDPGDLVNNALASADLDRFNRPQPAEVTTIATQSYRMFMQRMSEERGKLLSRYPSKIIYTRF